jgi:hypothetical protein
MQIQKYLERAFFKNTLKGPFCLRTLCPHGRFFFGRLVPPDVLSPGRFGHLDVLSLAVMLSKQKMIIPERKNLKRSAIWRKDLSYKALPILSKNGTVLTAQPWKK